MSEMDIKTPLIQQVYKNYQMNRTDFSKFSGIKYKTLENWETNGCSELGLVLLQKFIDLKELENKHQAELEQYKDKAERFDAIYNALIVKNH